MSLSAWGFPRWVNATVWPSWNSSHHLPPIFFFHQQRPWDYHHCHVLLFSWSLWVNSLLPLLPMLGCMSCASFDKALILIKGLYIGPGLKLACPPQVLSINSQRNASVLLVTFGKMPGHGRKLSTRLRDFGDFFQQRGILSCVVAFIGFILIRKTNLGILDCWLLLVASHQFCQLMFPFHIGLPRSQPNISNQDIVDQNQSCNYLGHHIKFENGPPAVVMEVKPPLTGYINCVASYKELLNLVIGLRQISACLGPLPQ